jgi:hypothetical protein
MLSAIFGIVGVIVGGLLNARVTTLLEHQRAGRALQAAVRLVG